MRPPPNSAALFKLRRVGRIPVPGPYGHVSILPDWNLTVAGAYVYAPPEIYPRELDFSFVAGLDVAIFIQLDNQRMPADFMDLLTAVMVGDPEHIAILDLNRNTLSLAMLALIGRRPNVK